MNVQQNPCTSLDCEIHVCLIMQSSAVLCSFLPACAKRLTKMTYHRNAFSFRRRVASVLCPHILINTLIRYFGSKEMTSALSHDASRNCRLRR